MAWAEEAQDQLGNLEGLVQDQKYDLETKDQEIRRLQKKIDNLKKDVFYKNKNQFDHLFLQTEVQNQKKEKEMLKARLTQLEADYSHLRIESEAPKNDVAQRENHFAKKIYKLENLVNDLKKKNTFLEKSRMRDDSISLKSAILGKEAKNKKIKGLGGVLENEEDSNEVEVLKQKIERLEAEKQVNLF